MKAIEITQFGAPEVLRLCDRPVPVPGVAEVLIHVAASGVNRPDVLQRTGHYPVPPGVSDIPGLEVAGTIVSGDADAMGHAGLQIGQRVCALLAGGGYAEFCVAPVGQCLPVPAGISDVAAATLPETFFTVWSNVFDRARLLPGETLLIHGGTSGIGVAAIQMAKALGAGHAATRVIVTAGSDDKCAACVALGADHAINYKTTDFAAEVLRLTNGAGANVVLDMVAGPYVARELGCMAEDGRLVIIAVQGGTQSEINAGLVLRRRLMVTGSTLRPRSAAFKAAIAHALRISVWPLLESGAIQPVVHCSFDVSGEDHAGAAARAHALMESGQHVGKIALSWNLSE